MTWDVMDVAETGVEGHRLHCRPPAVLHLLQPTADLCVAHAGFLDILGRVALHKMFLILAPCLRQAMGRSGKGSASSGLSVIIVL